MKTTLIALLVLLMVTPCLARSKKSQARIDKRNAAYAQTHSNITYVEGRSANQRTNDRKKQNRLNRTQQMQQMGQQQHQRAIRNGNQYRAQKAQRSRKHTGF